jgi:hypothetical protein
MSLAIPCVRALIGAGFRRRSALVLVALLVGAGFGQQALALPSYAQQTGQPCSMCHAIGFGPALTAYGRQFKLNAYSFGEHKKGAPVALMAIYGFNQTSKDLPDIPAEHLDVNNNWALNELTGFIATRFGDHSGGFIEAAYSGIERHTAWGAFDVRYARTFELGSHSIVGGVTLNNNPTVSDLWNSTPVWSFPYAGSEIAPTPGAAPILYDGISETVLGPSVYAMIDDKWYIELAAYRSLSDSMLGNVGLSADDSSHLDGAAPYWRLVRQFNEGPNQYSVGLLGLHVRQKPDPTAPGIDSFNDVGFDATYQHIAPDASNLQANFIYVHESRTLGAAFTAGDAARASGDLSSVKADVTWTWKQTWVLGGGLFNTTGSGDDSLYAADPVGGSRTGKPDSAGYLLQAEYVPFGKIGSPYRPWLNLRVGLQYTAYTKFNGASSDYDGFGRSASANNTLFGFLWVAL